MVGFMGIISKIAVVALFLGILTSISLDLLNIIATPFSTGAWKTLVVDIAKIVTNSQNTIAKSIDAFATSDAAYQTFLGWRIVGASVVTAVFIWAIYIGLKKLVRSTQYDLGTELLVFGLAFFSVWIIGLVASIVSGEGVPSFFGFYNGWIELILKRDVLVHYIMKAITS